MRDILYFLTVFVVIEFSSVYAELTTGPYEYVELSEFEICPEKEELECQFHIKMGNTKGNNVLVGSFKCPHPIDNQISVDFNALKQGTNGEYKPFYPYVEDNACEAGLDKFPEFLTEVYKSIDQPLKCPFPAGEFKVNDMATRFLFRKFPNLPYGKFRIDVSLMKDETEVGCFRLYGHAEPKKIGTTFGK